MIAWIGLMLLGGVDDTRPHPIDPGKARIGEVISDITSVDIAGRPVQIEGGVPTVIVLTSTTCPLTKKFGPTVASLEDTYRKKGIRFIFVNPTTSEPKADQKKDIARLKLDGPYVNDPEVARALGALTTTEAFLLDKNQRLVYRGAVDDQYGIGYALDKPRQKFLANALDMVLAGETPNPAATWSPGCMLALPAKPKAVATYYSRVAKIMQDNCGECHRPGGVGPFSLLTYQEVKDRGAMIKYVVDKGIMPPWFAAKDEHQGPWKNDRSLSEDERADLFAWIEAGMPMGNAKDAPKPKAYAAGEWTIGKPDATFQLPKPIEIKATGTMPYQEVFVDTNFSEEKWIEAMEVIPTARQVVHHVLIFVYPPGGKRSLFGNGVGEEIEGFFAAYVPGTNAIRYPDGMAKRVPAGSRLKFQLHYTPIGTATTDQTKLGLVFADKPPVHEVRTVGIANLGLNIPPGAPNHPHSGRVSVPYDVRVLSMIPHMHVRGKAARYEVIEPDGSRKRLLDVPRYDFNWQLPYEYGDPLLVKKGSQIEYTAWYDNSENNPANPDPTKRVRWGLQTYDEMHLGYMEYFIPGLKPGDDEAGLKPQLFGGAANVVEPIFKSMDKNGDGFVDQSEAGRSWQRLRSADSNGDGKISLDEAKKAFGG